MNLQNIHHLREVLVTDAYGKTTSIIQYSTQRLSVFRPTFVPIPLKDQAAARELYARLGGHRREGMRIGSQITVELGEREQV